MLKFDLNNQAKFDFSRKRLEKAVSVFANAEKLKGACYFSLAFIDNRTIKKINQSCRGKNQPTDVLSFAVNDARGFISAEKENYLGEILIAIPRARKQAKALGHSLIQEILRLLIHGLAHLAGYEHENVSARQAKKMVKFEEKVMKRV